MARLPGRGTAPSYVWRRGIGKLAALLILALALAAPARGEVTIAALGDSLTQGYGLPPQDGFVPALDRWLDRHGAEAELINAGVSGDTTAGGRARIDWTLTEEVDALIVALGGNDMLRAIDPALTRENLDAILSAAGAENVDVLLIGLEAPGNYGHDYKRAFDAIFPDLAEKHGALYLDSFFAGLPGEQPADAARFMQADGIHPNAEGVERIVAGVGPKVLDLIDRAGEGG